METNPNHQPLTINKINDMKTELNPKSLLWYGHGGTDICDEWHHNGNYYTTIARGGKREANHNYYADIYVTYKHGKSLRKDGYKTKVWVCLSASNSKDIILEDWVNFKTLKDAKQHVCELISICDNNSTSDKLIQTYLANNGRLVFAYVNGVFTRMGLTYSGMSMDYSSFKNSQWKETYLYYHNEVADYYANVDDRKFYTVDVDHKCERYISVLQPYSSGYSWYTETVRRDEILSDYDLQLTPAVIADKINH